MWTIQQIDDYLPLKTVQVQCLVGYCTRCAFINDNHISAAQVAGLAMGQKLRSLNIRIVRARLDGFGAGRITSLKGITQAGKGHSEMTSTN